MIFLEIKKRYIHLNMNSMNRIVWIAFPQLTEVTRVCLLTYCSWWVIHQLKQFIALPCSRLFHLPAPNGPGCPRFLYHLPPCKDMRHSLEQQLIDSREKAAATLTMVRENSMPVEFSINCVFLSNEWLYSKSCSSILHHVKLEQILVRPSHLIRLQVVKPLMYHTCFRYCSLMKSLEKQLLLKNIHHCGSVCNLHNLCVFQLDNPDEQAAQIRRELDGRLQMADQIARVRVMDGLIDEWMDGSIKGFERMSGWTSTYFECTVWKNTDQWILNIKDLTWTLKLNLKSKFNI